MDASRILAMVFLSITIFFEAWTLFACFLQPRLFRAGQSSSDQNRRVRNPNANRSPFDAGFVVRVLAFVRPLITCCLPASS